MARIYVTGFSCFGSVDANPTEELIQELTKRVQQPESDSQAKIIGTKCLEVSAFHVQKWIKHELYPFLEELEDAGPAPIVVVHLGVDEKSSQIKLENRACNEAKFRIPDQAGWQPDGIAIDRQEDCTFVRKTKLPVRKLAGSLRNYDVAVSQDAGRYVCNYSYFISLEESAKRKQMFPLFVHVPPFSKVSKGTQVEFLHDLFGQLATCFLEKWQEEEEEEGQVGEKGETEGIE